LRNALSRTRGESIAKSSGASIPTMQFDRVAQAMQLVRPGCPVGLVILWGLLMWHFFAI